MKILVVDDEALVAEALCEGLRTDGHEVCIGNDAKACLSLEETWHPDLIVLDVNMPGGMSGLDALRALRRRSDVPVILATARAGDVDKVLGLEYADDYMVKPFSHAELLARIRAIMRRAAGRPARADDGKLQVGELCIDRDAHEAAMAGRPLCLTATEMKILAVLADQAGKVISRSDLIEQVWGAGVYIDPHALDVHVGAVRRKLETDPSNPQHLVTVRAVGFRYVP